MAKEHSEHYTYLQPASVQPLRDYSGDIFAFTATLLVVNMVVPVIPKAEVDTLLFERLLQDWQSFAIYIISFLNISNYWMAHYVIFDNIIHANRTLTRLNILLLLSVTFLPYPSQLMSHYGRQTVVAVLYGLTISFTYLMLTVISWYAYDNNRLTRPEIHLPIRRVIGLRMLVPLLLALAGTGLAFYFPRLSFVFYFLVSLNFVLPAKLFMWGVDILTPDNPAS